MTLETKNKRVCIPISGACDNRCVFCMDDWELSQYISPDELYKKLVTAREYTDEVTFSSLEPTLHPKILRIIQHAHDLGFRVIELVTNGNRLQDIDFCRELVQAGVNSFALSIHSNCAEIHDRMVGNPGAFEKALDGLKNLILMRKTHPIQINICIVVCQWNYTHIYATVKYFQYFSVDKIILNILQMKNSAIVHGPQIAVRYSLLVKELLRLIPIQRTSANIRVNGFVPCISEQLSELIGYFNGAWVVPEIDGEYAIAFQSGKSKREECSRCRYTQGCEGVWDSYIDYFGWDDFVPISEPSSHA